MVQLFKTAKKYKGILIGYDIENAKYICKVKNAHEALVYLEKEIPALSDKERTLKKMRRIYIIPQWELALEKAQMYILKLQISIDIRDEQIFSNFQNFMQKMKPLRWEEPHYMYAKFLDDKLEEQDKRGNDVKPLDSRLKLFRLVNYTYCLRYGQK